MYQKRSECVNYVILTEICVTFPGKRDRTLAMLINVNI